MTTERIEINPAIMMGKPVIRGTRITVELILRKLAEGASEGELLQDYPHLTTEDLRAAVAYGAASVALDANATTNLVYKNMEVHLSPELQAKVERAAAENKSGAEEYVQQLVEHYVDHDAWFRQQVTRSLEQLDRGEFLTHEEVGARIDQMFRK